MFNDDNEVCARVDHLVRDWIRPAVVADRAALDLSRWEAPGEPVPFAEALVHPFEPVAVGTPWSRPWGTTWLRARGVVPTRWGVPGDQGGAGSAGADARVPERASAGPRHRVEMAVDLGFSDAQAGFQAEGTAYRPDGTVIKGVEPLNQYVPVEAGPGEPVDVVIEAASNPEVQSVDWTTPSRFGDPATSGTAPIYSLRALELRLIDTEVEALLADLDVVRGWVDVLPAGSPRQATLLRALRAALDALDPGDIAGSAPATREALRPALASPASPSSTDAYAVGHAHIDTAWLWPLRETRRKVARTFSNALRLMDEDPEFVFAASSAQQYEWLRLDHPDVFARIQRRVAEGRWVVVGGEWVESDAYVTGGEAFLRQFTEGLRYFREHFGVRPRHVWLPDSFGYSAALPGIARHAGMRWMLTQKLSWNETNTFPHSTFTWEGIDGSELFTHFPPVDTYNSDLSPAELARSERAFKDLGADGAGAAAGSPAGSAGATLVPFGYGDGGGGPRRERGRPPPRGADLEGSPRVLLTGPDQFFERAQADAPHPPVWLGELYLENHRGVLTSQHRTKRGNRRNEHLLREAELWAATAALRVGAPYPYQELRECWRTVLLLQFHDILPGSSIAWVHREAEHLHADVSARLEELIGASLRALAGEGALTLAANPDPFPVRGVPGGGVGAADQGGSPAVRIDGSALDGWVLDTGALRVHVAADGSVDSVVDVARGREVVPEGRALGALTLARDIPNDWDAWNIDRDYTRHVRGLGAAEQVSVRSVEDGAAVVHAQWHAGSSAFSQDLTVRPGSRALEFRTSVDWHERRTVLRLEVPLDLRTDHAQSEIQFGHLTRPIHTNTSWDQARFETVAQRWVRVEEGTFGVAVANDQTYGHGFFREKSDAGAGIVRISEALLRSPMAPDPDADQGRHEGITTAVVIGASTQDAIHEGYRLNLPERRLTGVAHPVDPVVEVREGTAVVEAVKLADDRSGDLVVRLYESLGERTLAVLRVDPSARGGVAGRVSATLVDALEEPLGAEDLGQGGTAGGGSGSVDEARGGAETAVEVSADGELRLPLTPFQIRTLRVTFA